MSFRVTILPHDVTVDAEDGEKLMDVLVRADVSLESECGGQGTCGKCVVSIVSGTCRTLHSDCLLDGGEQGQVLACAAEICDDLTVRVPLTDRVMVCELGDSLRELVPRGRSVSDLSPLSRKTVHTVISLESPANVCDLERAVALLGDLQAAEWSVHALRELPSAIRSDEGRFTVTTAEHTRGRRIIRIERGDTTGRHYGMCCDIGTTTVAVRLVDLESANVIGTATAYNDQIACGSDVISRIIYSQRPGHLEELRRRVIGTINALVDSTAAARRLDSREIVSAVFAGNTTMTHLSLGIDPRFIREAPYSPVVKSVPVLSADDLGIHIHDEASCFFSPCVGSYVGGDITAGLLCVEQEGEKSGVDLFMDVGTNGEMVVRGEDWMIGCACSAGPAFEGVGIRCGMRAANGAIYSVEVGCGDEDISWKVLGDGAPRGICGSGLIDLVAGLFRAGIIGRDGRFAFGSHPRLRRSDGRLLFVIVDASASATGRDIVLTEHDIANIMRAKAAIFAALTLLLKNVGLTTGDVARISIAGGFGSYLNIENAVAIGLLPDLARDRFEYLGNTSLMGGQLALLSRTQRNRLAEIAKQMTYVDLSSEQRYMDAYTASLFLPHTDGSLFPSVKA